MTRSIFSTLGLTLIAMMLANLFRLLNTLDSNTLDIPFVPTVMTTTIAASLLEGTLSTTVTARLTATDAFENEDNSSSPKIRQETHQTKAKQAYHLAPTFEGFHNFPRDGPRWEPFSHGLSIQDLLHLNGTNTVGDKAIEVSFDRSKNSHYAAAWLSTIDTFLANKNFFFESNRSQWKKDWNPNLEAGTWSGVKGQMNHRTIDARFLCSSPVSLQGSLQEWYWTRPKSQLEQVLGGYGCHAAHL